MLQRAWFCSCISFCLILPAFLAYPSLKFLPVLSRGFQLHQCHVSSQLSENASGAPDSAPRSCLEAAFRFGITLPLPEARVGVLFWASPSWKGRLNARGLGACQDPGDSAVSDPTSESISRSGLASAAGTSAPSLSSRPWAEAASPVLGAGTRLSPRPASPGFVLGAGARGRVLGLRRGEGRAQVGAPAAAPCPGRGPWHVSTHPHLFSCLQVPLESLGGLDPCPSLGDFSSCFSASSVALRGEGGGPR